MANAMLKVFHLERYKSYIETIQTTITELVDRVKSILDTDKINTKEIFDYAESLLVEGDEEYDDPITTFSLYWDKYHFFFSALSTRIIPYIQLVFTMINKYGFAKPVYKKEDISVYRDPEKDYFEKQRKKWDTLYAPEIDICSVNHNICALFYKKAEFLEHMKQEKTELEMEWRRRILLEHTPRGNIIMFYDVYKQGFAYYADQMMPYHLLNAVAMKYVVIFGCRDFFLDNQYTDTESPFLEIYEKPDKPTIPNNDETKTKIDTNLKVFAKLKNYNTVSSKVKPSQIPPSKVNPVLQQIASKFIPLTPIQNDIPDKIIWKNRFVSNGKLVNYRMLQVAKKNHIRKEPIPLGNSIEKHNEEIAEQCKLQKEFMSYRDFKLAKKSNESM